MEAIDSVEMEHDVFGSGRVLESPDRSEFVSARSSRGLFSNPEDGGAGSARGEQHKRRPSNYSFAIDLNLANQSREQS